MIQFKVKKETYLLPTSYGEISLRKIQSMPDVANDPVQMFQFLMDCPHRISANAVAPYAQFLNDVVDLKLYEPADDIPDIRTDTYLKRLVCEDLIKGHRQTVAITKVLSLYLSLDLKFHKSNDDEFIKGLENAWMNKTLDEVAPIYLNIVNQLNEFKKLEDSIKPEPDPQQIEAGLSEFAKYGWFPTVDMLAHGRIWRHEAVLAMDCNTILTKLSFESTKNTFSKKLKAIMERDAKANARTK